MESESFNILFKFPIHTEVNFKYKTKIFTFSDFWSKKKVKNALFFSKKSKNVKFCVLDLRLTSV
jgi:hypothetical protein